MHARAGLSTLTPQQATCRPLVHARGNNQNCRIGAGLTSDPGTELHTVERPQYYTSVAAIDTVRCIASVGFH